MIYFIGANCSGRLQGMFYLTQEGTEQFQSYPPFLYSYVVLKKWGQSVYCAKKKSFHLVSRIYFQCYCQYLVVVGSRVKHLYQCLKITVRQSKEKKLLFLQILVMQTKFIQLFYQISQNEKSTGLFFNHNFEVFSQCNSLIFIFIHCHFNIVFPFSKSVCIMNTSITLFKATEAIFTFTSRVNQVKERKK